MIKKYFYLLAIGLIWGSQFLFQQAAVNDLPPVWVGAGRATVGALTLIILTTLFGMKSRGSRISTFSFIALLEATIPFVLIAWGQQYLDTAVTAILMGTIPFFTIVLSPLVLRGSRITPAGMASVVIGFCGLVLLFYPQLSSGTGHSSLLGALAVVIASGCFATGLLLLKKINDEHPIIVARNVLTCSCVQLLVVASLIQAPWTLELTSASTTSILYLGVMCAGVVYFLYMALIAQAGPVFASMNNYLVPLIGVLLGALINHEVLPSTAWLALGVIVAALAINQLFEKAAPKATA
ncbi:DMT family transporter [Endozoicomonas arenosclerae]|uniref:DMT family transporter n=1 Tax=Endozoicomonas arenosclerae TaxID=1633495 RepID=UPI000781D6DF|nr:EamA family transporter [Endozoicomonas arenosclerae]